MRDDERRGGAWMGVEEHGGAWRGVEGRGGAWRGVEGRGGARRGKEGCQCTLSLSLRSMSMRSSRRIGTRRCTRLSTASKSRQVCSSPPPSSPRPNHPPSLLHRHPPNSTPTQPQSQLHSPCYRSGCGVEFLPICILCAFSGVDITFAPLYHRALCWLIDVCQRGSFSEYPVGTIVIQY